jgi:hypothetical protein
VSNTRHSKVDRSHSENHVLLQRHQSNLTFARRSPQDRQTNLTPPFPNRSVAPKRSDYRNEQAHISAISSEEAKVVIRSCCRTRASIGAPINLRNIYHPLHNGDFGRPQPPFAQFSAPRLVKMRRPPQPSAIPRSCAPGMPLAA